MLVEHLARNYIYIFFSICLSKKIIYIKSNDYIKNNIKIYIKNYSHSFLSLSLSLSFFYAHVNSCIAYYY